MLRKSNLDLTIFRSISTPNLEEINIQEDISHLFLLTNDDNKPELLQLLDKILSACKLPDEEKQIILPLDKTISSFSVSQMYPKLKSCISFDCTPSELGLNCSTIKNNVFLIGSCSFVFTYSLNQLQTNLAKKGEFWRSLKVLFNIQ